MARNKNWWNHSKANAIFIWFISAVIFFTLLQMALQNESSSFRRNSSSDNEALPNAVRRSRLYDKMEMDLDEHGADFIKQGVTSQSLSLSDLFTLKDGSVTPILKVADPPVRANVLYLSTEYSLPISEAVKSIFLPHFDNKIWFQNSSLFHFSMFHASHHIEPVLATGAEIESEANGVKDVADVLCPLKIVLDRVLLTSTGVLLGCWQVNSGTDPIILRAKLKTALPRAPKKQLYDAAILHTSFARLLGGPNASASNSTSDLQFFHELVSRLNDKIKGFQATVTELWYVEEYDVLALALNGRMKVRKFPLACHL